MYGLKLDWVDESHPRYYSINDYEGAIARWCSGCGDHAILTAVQKLCRDEQLPPEKTVFVSGIGCSSRFPHYMKTYGFHGLHGRALPVATGVRARRPDLSVFVATGDGDCTSIGAGHWLHAIRYNMKMVVMLLDNNVYGLTKMQTSPTSPKGLKTNTHPRGALLEPLDIIQTVLGVTNVSFAARTVDWNPVHLLATLKAAHHHQGFAFVHILQRCPHYTDQVFEDLQEQPSRVTLMHHPDGIPADDTLKRVFKQQVEHDPRDMNRARELAARKDTMPIGVFYRSDSVFRYDNASAETLGTNRAKKIAALESELEKFTV